jgi:hypothetical protein
LQQAQLGHYAIAQSIPYNRFAKEGGDWGDGLDDSYSGSDSRRIPSP